MSYLSVFYEGLRAAMTYVWHNFKLKLIYTDNSIKRMSIPKAKNDYAISDKAKYNFEYFKVNHIKSL